MTPGVAKHRLFAWLEQPIQPDHALFAVAADDDHTFGILHSRFHEVWALAQGTQLEDRPRYTPTTCFETFPFPNPTESQRAAISAAAVSLNQLRENWLNPPEWTREETLVFPATVGGPWHRWIPNAEGLEIGSVHKAHYKRIVPKPGMDKLVAARTMTKLYNEKPAWLRHAHRILDEAVADAYHLPVDITDADLLAALLALNLAQSQTT